MLRVCTTLLLLLLSAVALHAAEQSGFRVVDFNNDSKLTADEFVKLMMDQYLNDWSTKEWRARQVISKNSDVDKNGDGCVTDSEIDAAVNVWVFAATFDMLMLKVARWAPAIPLDGGVSEDLGRFDLDRNSMLEDGIEYIKLFNGAGHWEKPEPVVNAIREAVKTVFLHDNGCTDLSLSNDTETAQAQFINFYKPVVEGMFVYLDKDGNGVIELGTPAGRR